MECSGQWSMMRMPWWPEEVSGAEVGHQMGGSRLALVENGELLSVAQLGCDKMKAGRRCHKGSDLSFLLLLLHFPELPPLITFSSGFLNCKLTTKPLREDGKHPSGATSSSKWKRH